MRMPSLFVSHGAPTFALEPGHAGPRLREVGARLQQLAGLRALLVVSPHWRTRELRVGASATPATVHDFGGFPSALYQLQYPVSGAPDIACEVQQCLANAGKAATLVEGQGLDHGVWVPLMHMLPDASVPVVPLSLPIAMHAADALALGRALAPLRERGIVVIGSGSLTHNLYEFRQSHSEAPEAYVREFSHWAAQAALAHDEITLADLRNAPNGLRAHPTDEHYLPLLIALGASPQGETVERIEGGIAHSVLSMDGYVFGALH